MTRLWRTRAVKRAGCPAAIRAQETRLALPDTSMKNEPPRWVTASPVGTSYTGGSLQQVISVCCNIEAGKD